MSAEKPVFLIPNQNYYSRLISVFDMMGYGDAIKITNSVSCAAKNKVFFVPYVLHMEHPNLVIYDQFITEIRAFENAYIILDYSEEAIPLRGAISQKFVELHHLLKEHKFDEKKIFVAAAGNLMEEEYDQWRHNNNIDYKLNVIGFNPLLFRNIYWLVNNEWFRNSAKKIITYCEDKSLIREKKFMCLNLRPRSHRAALVSFLFEKSHIQDGIITYFGEEFGIQDSISVAAVKETEDFIRAVDPSLKLLENFKKLQKISPLRFDRDSSEMRNSAYSNENLQKWRHLIPELSDDENIKIATYFEMPTETWFEEGNVFVSEKVMRAIVRMQFFIVVGSPYTLRYLRELGFKTFSPLIDESYDEIADPVERMKKILLEVDHICSMSKTELRDFYYQLFEIVKFNYLFLLKQMPESFKKGIEKKLLSRIKKLQKGSNNKVPTLVERFKKSLAIRKILKKNGGLKKGRRYRFDSNLSKNLFKNFNIF